MRTKNSESFNSNGKDYGKLLGQIRDAQLQAALDTFGLGQLVSAKAIPFGLFGQNIFLESTSGSYILRTHSHYDWQLPTERYFCELIHTKTDIPVPWPYLLSESEEIFGFIWGFAIMPRLPGITTADPNVYKSFTQEQKINLAIALGTALRELQKLTSDVSGKYDYQQNKVVPFPKGYVARTVERIKSNFEASTGYPDSHITKSDEHWLESILAEATKLTDDFHPVIVHEDFNCKNACIEKNKNNWHVSGLFDLMTAHYGDGLADLSRQFSMFTKEGSPKAAKQYLETYTGNAILDSDAKQRLELYLIDDRLLDWNYFHRPNHDRSSFNEKLSFGEWLQPFLDALRQAVD